MLVKVVKKLWQGKYASIRDYEQKAAIKEGGIEIKFNNKTVILNADQLKLYKPQDRVFESKFGKPYKLVDIPFEVNHE